MKASLMMYARPELDAVNARYWALIRTAMAARGIQTPEQIDNDAPEFDVWLSPDLVFSQTCALPFRTRLKGHIEMIGTPDFGLEGCPAGHYRSAVVVRADDIRDTGAAFKSARFVYNQACSQSGYGAAVFWARAQGFEFSDTRASGSHRNSAAAIASGEADIGVLDGNTWKYIQRYDAFANDLKVIGWTTPTPGLPYITAKGNDTDAMFDAVSEAIAALDPRDRAALNITSLVKIPHAHYMAQANPPDPS